MHLDGECPGSRNARQYGLLVLVEDSTLNLGRRPADTGKLWSSTLLINSWVINWRKVNVHSSGSQDFASDRIALVILIIRISVAIKARLA